jgi:hypothetical protein
MIDDRYINIDTPPEEPKKVNVGSRTHSPDKSVMAEQGANVNSNHFTESNKLLPWLIFTSILSGFSLATAVFVLIEFAEMQNNMARMAVHIMSNDALLLREGILQPGDQWHGPEGNLEYGRKDRPQPRSK